MSEQRLLNFEVRTIVCFLFVLIFPLSAAFSADAKQPQPPLVVARQAIQAKKFAEANSLLLDFLRGQVSATEAAEAQFWIGLIQINQEQIDDALRTFGSLQSSARGTEWAAKAFEESAKLHELRKNRASAQRAREDLLREYPGSPTTARIWLPVADTFYQERRFAEAAGLYSQLESQLKGISRQRYQSAKAIAESNNNPTKLLAAADLALTQNDPALAEILLKTILQQQPPAPAPILVETKVKRAWCLYLEGSQENLEAAEKIWSAVATQEPKGEWGGTSRWHLVQLHAGPKNDWQKATKLCQSLSKDFPPGSFRHEQALYTRAWLFWAQKHWAEAQTAFAELIEFYPAKAEHPPIIGYLRDIASGLATKPQPVAP